MDADFLLKKQEVVRAYCATRTHERIEVEDIAVASINSRLIRGLEKT